MWGANHHPSDLNPYGSWRYMIHVEPFEWRFNSDEIDANCSKESMTYSTRCSLSCAISRSAISLRSNDRREQSGLNAISVSASDEISPLPYTRIPLGSFTSPNSTVYQ